MYLPLVVLILELSSPVLILELFIQQVLTEHLPYLV